MQHDEKWKDPPENVDELMDRIKTGERYFPQLILQGQDLSNLNLSNLDLFGAQFNKCKLIGTHLHNTSLSHSRFRKCTFKDSRIIFVDFSEGDFEEVTINNAIIDRSNFSGLSIDSSEICKSTFEGSKFTYTYFSSVKFQSCLFFDALFDSCFVESTKFESCKLDNSKIINTELEAFCQINLEKNNNVTIDWRSIATSLNTPKIKTFLLSTGMPDLLCSYTIDTLNALDPERIFKLMQNVFISYGEPDTEFAKILRDDLQKNGVKAWFFPDDAKYGQKLHKLMRENVNKHDKILLICSEKSLKRSGVLNEIEQALSREAREGGTNRIIPLRLDKYIFSEEFKKTDAGQEFCDRVIADFSNPDQYRNSLSRLIEVLYIDHDTF